MEFGALKTVMQLAFLSGLRPTGGTSHRKRRLLADFHVVSFTLAKGKTVFLQGIVEFRLIVQNNVE
jgi:hypothetical protein